MSPTLPGDSEVTLGGRGLHHMQKGVRALKGIYGIWEGEGGGEGLQFMRCKLINQLVEEGKGGSTKLKDNVLKEQCKLMVLPLAGDTRRVPNADQL